MARCPVPCAGATSQRDVEVRWVLGYLDSPELKSEELAPTPEKKTDPFPLCHFSKKNNGDERFKELAKWQNGNAHLRQAAPNLLRPSQHQSFWSFPLTAERCHDVVRKVTMRRGKSKGHHKNIQKQEPEQEKNKSKREPGRTGRGSQNRSCCQPNEGSYHEMGIFLWHVFMSSSCLDEKASFLHPQSPIALYCSSKRLNTWFQQIGANSCKCPPYFDFKNLAFYFTSDSQVIWIYGATPFFSRSPWRVNSFASPTSGWTSSSADVWCEVNQLDSKSSKFHQYLSLSPPQQKKKQSLDDLMYCPLSRDVSQQ